MRMFYHENTNSLIAVPYRNGSTHLLHSTDVYQLIHLNLNTQIGKSAFETITSDKKLNKIFFYRNPIERFLSFYVHFVAFAVTPSKTDEMAVILNKGYNKKVTIWDNLYSALPLIEKHYKNDMHTQPQHSYFAKNEEDRCLHHASTGEEVQNYTVYDVADYSKWLYLTFGKKIPRNAALDNPELNFNISGIDFFKLMEIHDVLKELYKDDLTFLAPEVTRL